MAKGAARRKKILNYVIVSAGGTLHHEESEMSCGNFQYTLYETGGTDYNYISLPIEVTGLAMASDLANHIEGHSSGAVTILTVSRWNAPAQGWTTYDHTFGFADYAIVQGQVFRVEISGTGGNVTWPV